ncbi:MAG: mechanosensitive ion channel family protein [Candidatus Omnitrophica bacterium]|nr:mechanosensitive ion channel family protein [Candidatus Omnitrophota bacterium]
MTMIKDVMSVLFIWKSLSIVLIIISTIIIQKVVKGIIKQSARDDEKEPKQIAFLVRLFSAIIFLLGFVLCIYTIEPFRSLSASIFAGSGVLAIIIGFAAQHAFSNVVSGVFIAIFKPFRVGDKIKFVGKEVSGVVEDITLRHTVVRTFENKRVIIPNSVVSSDIIENASIIEEKVCRFFDVGISYDSDIDKATALVKDEVLCHPDFFDNRTDDEKRSGIEPVIVRVIGWGESSINVRAWIWAKDNTTGFNMVCDLYKSVKKRFDKEGIHIPFPHRTIVVKNT